jgi:pilus assembly protein CpaE
VGTTTLAVNLAVLLRRLTVEPVLLVDLATEQGAVSVHMNLNPKVTLADLPSDPSSVELYMLQSMITHHASGVDILAAPPSPQSAELVSPASVSAALPVLKAHYRWIVLDTSAAFSELNLGVLDQSDLLLLTFAPDVSSLKVMQSTLDVLAALQTPAEKRVLVLNQVYPKPHLQPSDIENTLGERIGLTLPYAEEALLDTIDKGIPLAVDAATHPTVAAIEAFATKLAQINVDAATQPKRGGFGRWVQGIVSGLRR